MHAMSCYKAHIEGRLVQFDVESVLPDAQVSTVVAECERLTAQAKEAAAKLPAAGLHSHQHSLTRLEYSLSAVRDLREQLTCAMHRIRLRNYANEVSGPGVITYDKSRRTRTIHNWGRACIAWDYNIQSSQFVLSIMYFGEKG